MRIVQLANLVTATSGGIRTYLDRTGAGYAAAGHERHLVVPGAHRRRVPGPGGTVTTLPGWAIPRSGGYRLLVDRAAVVRVLEELEPDTVEVNDRWSLGWVGPWARARGVRAVLVAHERLDATVATWLPVGGRAVVARLDRALVGVDAVVAPSRHAAAGLPVPATVVPFGVDLERFRPRPRRGEDQGPLRLLVVGRLSREKRVERAVDALVELRRRGVAASLTVAGDGPERRRLERHGRGAPIHWRGHLGSRRTLAAVVASADVLLAPCEIETFGLAALEALASGVAVATVDGGAIRELLVGEPVAGAVGAVSGVGLADAVERLVVRPRSVRRQAARQLAEGYGWDQTVARMLEVHGATSPATLRTAVEPPMDGVAVPRW
ncbi:MAG: glycosyltransferase [Actinomycetes bacterium]